MKPCAGMKQNITIALICFLLFVSCNSSKKAERATDDVDEVTLEVLDSVMVHYLERLDVGEDMPEISQEEFEVLSSLEQKLVLQLQECLSEEDLLRFEENQSQWEAAWQQKKDSVIQANADVIFEEDAASKEMFLVWQYSYLKELRIAELIELRNSECR